MTNTPTVYVDVYQTKPKTKQAGRPQKWRWRALNANNNHIMAMSSEAYTNRQDCLDAIEQLFSEGTEVCLRQDGETNMILREPNEPDWQLRLPEDADADD